MFRRARRETHVPAPRELAGQGGIAQIASGSLMLGIVVLYAPHALQGGYRRDRHRVGAATCTASSASDTRQMTRRASEEHTLGTT
eukprot:3045252-Pyramimonas_sp.AAC.1